MGPQQSYQYNQKQTFKGALVVVWNHLSVINTHYVYMIYDDKRKTMLLYSIFFTLFLIQMLSYRFPNGDYSYGTQALPIRI